MPLPNAKSKAQAVEVQVKEAEVLCLKLQKLQSPQNIRELAIELRAVLTAALARAKTI